MPTPTTWRARCTDRSTVTATPIEATPPVTVTPTEATPSVATLIDEHPADGNIDDVTNGGATLLTEASPVHPTIESIRKFAGGKLLVEVGSRNDVHRLTIPMKIGEVPPFAVRSHRQLNEVIRQIQGN